MSGHNLKDAFVSRHLLALTVAALLLTIALPICHLLLPHEYGWYGAVFSPITILFTHPLAAVQFQEFINLKLGGVSLLGRGWSSWFAMVWMAYHVCHFRSSALGFSQASQSVVPFSGWYISSCVIIDWR